MIPAKMIDITKEEYIDSEWYQVRIKGIYFNNEYDVDIYYGKQGGSYVYYTFEREHVTCKRVSTINKKLAVKGFTYKLT